MSTGTNKKVNASRSRSLSRSPSSSSIFGIVQQDTPVNRRSRSSTRSRSNYPSRTRTRTRDPFHLVFGNEEKEKQVPTRVQDNQNVHVQFNDSEVDDSEVVGIGYYGRLDKLLKLDPTKREAYNAGPQIASYKAIVPNYKYMRATDGKEAAAYYSYGDSMTVGVIVPGNKSLKKLLRKCDAMEFGVMVHRPGQKEKFDQPHISPTPGRYGRTVVKANRTDNGEQIDLYMYYKSNDTIVASKPSVHSRKVGTVRPNISQKGLDRPHISQKKMSPPSMLPLKQLLNDPRYVKLPTSGSSSGSTSGSSRMRTTSNLKSSKNGVRVSKSRVRRNESTQNFTLD